MIVSAEFFALMQDLDMAITRCWAASLALKLQASRRQS